MQYLESPHFIQLKTCCKICHGLKGAEREKGRVREEGFWEKEECFTHSDQILYWLKAFKYTEKVNKLKRKKDHLNDDIL